MTRLARRGHSAGAHSGKSEWEELGAFRLCSSACGAIRARWLQAGALSMRERIEDRVYHGERHGYRDLLERPRSPSRCQQQPLATHTCIRRRALPAGHASELGVSEQGNGLEIVRGSGQPAALVAGGWGTHPPRPNAEMVRVDVRHILVRGTTLLARRSARPGTKCHLGTRSRGGAATTGRNEASVGYVIARRSGNHRAERSVTWVRDHGA